MIYVAGILCGVLLFAFFKKVAKNAYIEGYCDATEAIYAEQANEVIEQLRSLK